MSSSPRRSMVSGRQGPTRKEETRRSPQHYASRLNQNRVAVSDMVKMFTPPDSTQFRNRAAPPSAGRKWPPVPTPGAPAGNKPPPPMAPKPLASHRPPTAAKPFQSDNRANVPKWRQDRQAQSEVKQDNTPPWLKNAEKKEENLPPWKQRQQQGEQAAKSEEDSPKPSWSHNREESNIPPWKQRQQKEEEVPTEDRRPSWAKRNGNVKSDMDTTVPAWKRGLNRAKEETERPKENTPSWKSKPQDDLPKPPNSWSKPKIDSADSTPSAAPRWGPEPQDDLPKPPNSWSKPKIDNADSTPSAAPRWGPKPPTKPDFGSKPSHTVPWSERNKQNNEPPGIPSAMLKPSDSSAPKRSSPQSQSFTGYQTMPKPSIEKSSGSFGSASPKITRKASEPTPPSNVNASPQRRVSSFLHTGPKSPPSNPAVSLDFPPPPSPINRPTKSNGLPKRLPIPEEKFYEPPPLKTAKPPNVVLPSKGKKKMSLPSLPNSLFSRSKSPRDPPEEPPPPPVARDLPAIPPSPMGDSDYRPPPLLPPQIGGRDLPPPPGSRDGHSPNLPPLPSRPDLPPPDLPARPLPPRNQGLIPLPVAPTIEDDIYDDAADEPAPPPPPPPMAKQPSRDLIQTWDDEEDDIDNVYDETPDAPPLRPQIPTGFPMPGGPAPIIPEDDGEDMYEDVEEYMRLKKLQQQGTPANGSVPDGKDKKEKDKKKKDSEKREKDIRKKFKLPAEGDIIPEGNGIVKQNCKGGSKNLAVTKDERIEIIRMANNPKGKWLIRNVQGEYGYVESEKVNIDVSQLRQTFGVGNKAPPPGIGGSPAPPVIIPTTDSDDGEAIYDQTADEDIYEEV